MSKATQEGGRVLAFKRPAEAREPETRVDALLEAVTGPVLRVQARAGQIRLTSAEGVTRHSASDIEAFAYELLDAVLVARCSEGGQR